MFRRVFAVRDDKMDSAAAAMLEPPCEFAVKPVVLANLWPHKDYEAGTFVHIAAN